MVSDYEAGLLYDIEDRCAAAAGRNIHTLVSVASFEEPPHKKPRIETDIGVSSKGRVE